MSDEKSGDFRTYGSFRLQLAELALMLFQRAATFPAVRYEILETNSRVSRSAWENWISESRRTDDEDRESWDIYPPGWVVYDETVVKLAEEFGASSNICGRYVCETGKLKAARRDLETLAATGMKLLKSIEREAREFDPMEKLVFARQVPPGHRGWFDAIRMTAETHRCVLLDVRHRFWGVDLDERASREFAEHRLEEAGRHDLLGGVRATEIVPDVFTACGNAIRLWLEENPPAMIQKQHPLHNFRAITIPAMEQPDEAMVRLGLVGPPLQPVDGATARPGRKKPKKQGAKRKDAVGDRRFYDAWETKQYRTFAEVAKAFNTTAKEAELRITRCRKHLNRHAGKH